MTGRFLRIALLAEIGLTTFAARAVTEWPLERLQLAAGYLDGPAVRTERNVREMSEAGIDLLIHGRNGDTNTMALLKKYGIKTILNDICENIVCAPDQVGHQRELLPPAWYAMRAKLFVDAPAVAGIDAGDEPSALDFPYLGEVAEQVSGLFPGKYPYFNIYPNYASAAGLDKAAVNSQLGTSNYLEHVAAFARHMPLNYICFDHYLYADPVTPPDAVLDRFHDNFRIVSDACRESGRQLCFWAQACSSPYVGGWTSANKMRYQAFTALAYGARMICWGCYAGGWWTNRVLTATGEKTEQYEKLKSVNLEIRRLQPVYDRLRWLGTSRVRERPLDAGVFRGVRSTDGSELVVGEFAGRGPDDPARALLIVAGRDPWDKTPHDVSVVLSCAFPVRLCTSGGESPARRDDRGELRFSLKANGCALLTVRPMRMEMERDDPETSTVVCRLSGAERTVGRGLYDRLSSLSRECVRTGRAFRCLDAEGTTALAALAFGAEGGEDLGSLGTVLADFRPTASTFVSVPGRTESVAAFSNGYFLGLRAEDGAGLVVGDRVAKDERKRRRALVVFVPDGSASGRRTHSIVFTVRGRISVIGRNGSIPVVSGERGVRSFELHDGDVAAVLLDNNTPASDVPMDGKRK